MGYGRGFRCQPIWGSNGGGEVDGGQDELTRPNCLETLAARKVGIRLYIDLKTETEEGLG